MTALPRSWLYVPGDRPDRFAKAAASGADQVVIDLEDSVAAARKDYARRAAVEWLAASPVPVTVRINDPRSGEGRRDVDAVLSDGAVASRLYGFRVPKAEDAGEARRLGEAVESSGSGASLFLLLESAAGVMRIAEMAAAHPLVRMAGLGAGDLAADLGVGATADAGQWAEGWVVFQSRALGLLPPPMSVFPDIRNLGSLRSDCLRGRALGFYGRSAINPAQVDVINRAFTPPGEEVARAREIVRSLQDPGSGVTVVGGHVVDAATVKHAERVIALASQYSDGSASA